MERVGGGKYKLGRRIGSGSFGEIFLGYQFDYVFEWTILKCQQAQMSRIQPHFSPASGGRTSRPMPMEIDNRQGVVDASYPTDVADHVRTSNIAGPGFSMKLKAVADKNPISGYSLNRTISSAEIVPSTSFALGGTSSRSSMKPQPPTEGGSSGHGTGGRTGPPSGWISSFQ